MANGSERVVTFDLPLPLAVVAPLLQAIGETLEAEGWAHVRYHQEGYVVATPPGKDLDNRPPVG